MSRGPGARGQWQKRFPAAMHGQDSGTTRMNAVTVPGRDTELLLLANVACDTYDKGDGLAAIAAVKAAEPNITFSKKDPMLILDAPTFLENKALTHICHGCDLVVPFGETMRKSMRAVATFIGHRRRREATPMRRPLIAVAGLAVGVGVALAQAATTHAYPSDPAVGKSCDSPGRWIARASYHITDAWLVCWGTHEWVEYDPDFKVPLGSPCSGNTIPGLFGTTKIALVDGFTIPETSITPGVTRAYQTPQNYPMTQSGPVPVPM